ncbi:hypothetical protein [Iningainema tapete]|uniref:Uncharacterized protein n=1 Tax=Iningainema tapete BLCC-T55 TaxID=2748662 RepID=A0A8J6XDB1_9CYAN|nr:hypothetical protein [Iningainema tapete]MBD2771203.1 hypothetical protein [Iningainema tapete BLCC-T55]
MEIVGPKTLKEQLDICIEEHGLAEVLDRLTDLAHERCKRSEKPCDCTRITNLLEEATREALVSGF